MDHSEKDELKIKFGLALLKVIQANKIKSEENKKGAVKDLQLIDSLRKLESSSGIPYASIHRIASGTKNPSFTTIVAIMEGLSITLGDFFNKYYNSITNAEIDAYKKMKGKKSKQSIKGRGKRIRSKKTNDT